MSCFTIIFTTAMDKMLKIMTIVALIFVSLSFFIPGFFVTTVNAHELLPKSVIGYVENNPDATPDEIKAFFAAENPELYEGYASETNILEAATQQDPGLFNILRDFSVLGIKHILGGLDHILFVLSLLLVFVSLRQTLKLATVFTIAHSITLILAAAGIFIVSPSIVEPLIALSIAYIAFTSVFLRDKSGLGSARAKTITVFLFGLFHGLGFSGLLREINIPASSFLASLVSFNIGIEIGQLLIIALGLVVVYLFRTKAWYPTFIKIAALVITAIGLTFFFERII